VRIALRSIYLALIAVWLLGLGAEVALAVQRRLAWPAAEHWMREQMEPLDSSAITDREVLWLERYVRYRPGASLEIAKPAGVQRIRINAQGFRGREFSPAKSPGTLRVVAIGGSTTAQGPSDDATYPALLEAKLRARFPGRAIEVLNLGVSATWSDYWLSPARDLFAFEPDVVVQYDGINDVAFVDLHHWAEAHPWRRTLYRSLLVERLFPPPPASFDALFEATLRNHLRIARRTRERGAAYVAGAFATPDPARLSAVQRRYVDHDVTRLWGRALGLRTYAPFHALVARYDALLEARLRERGIPIVPAQRELADPALFTDSCHLSPAGLDALAEAFLPEVARAIEARL
jgi:lysophospholipase L1-like esterase